ncbi:MULTISPECIES: ATP-binding protein [Thermomonosporaceae]|uniref:ATP-binding protein n=1 Tax=Thermomonosporaceae TaxID=2012 RepID=UPI00255AA405|nr:MULTISPECIES: ATP-binding protein [Thermomonosporaceae]MDL4771064.1 ATP-binding protein [Actinomadura xylanilytica]
MGIDALTSGELDMTCTAALTVAGQVRCLVEFRLVEWGLARLVDDVRLIAGELVANAVRAAPGREVRVRFAREQGAVLLGVWDSAGEMPRTRPVVELTLEALDLDPGNFDNNGGWGLPVVEALASECGVLRTEPYGKWVWARLRA